MITTPRLAALAAALLVGCSSAPQETAKPEPPRLRVAQPEASTVGNYGREESPERLFLTLDQQLRNARDPGTKALAGRQLDRVLARYVDANFDAIASTVGGDNEDRELIAVWSLGYATNPRATRILLRALDERSPEVRANALHALGHRADPTTPLRPILELFHDEDIGVRCNAARAVRDLVTRESLEAVVPLTGLLADPEPQVRLPVVGALGQIGAPECRGFLVNALRDPVPLVRGQAALGLGKCGDPNQVPVLLTFLRAEQHDLVVQSLVKAIGALTNNHFESRQACFEWWLANRADFQ